jgi:hypothetical protein
VIIPSVAVTPYLDGWAELYAVDAGETIERRGPESST